MNGMNVKKKKELKSRERAPWKKNVKHAAPRGFNFLDPALY